MKIIVSSIVGLVLVTTIMVAQNQDNEKSKEGYTLEYIKKETIGGKLDFTSVLKEPGYTIDHNGVRFNKNDYHVFLWGRAVSNLGLESSYQATELWEDIHRKALTGPQRTALRIGFEKQLK